MCGDSCEDEKYFHAPIKIDPGGDIYKQSSLISSPVVDISRFDRYLIILVSLGRMLQIVEDGSLKR